MSILTKLAVIVFEALAAAAGVGMHISCGDDTRSRVDSESEFCTDFAFSLRLRCVYVYSYYTEVGNLFSFSFSLKAVFKVWCKSYRVLRLGVRNSGLQ